MLKQKDLLSYVESVTGRRAINAGTETAKFKVCPICGGGDHFTIKTTGNYYNCWDNNADCGKGTIIDFYKKYYGTDNKTAITELRNYFNLGDDNMSDTRTKEIKREVKPITEKPVKAYKEIDLTSIINNYYTSNENDLTYFVDDRGISEDSITNKYKYCSGDIKNIFKDNLELLPRLNNINAYEHIIPVWENGKVVNCILRRNDSKSNENAKTLNLKDVEVKLFNADYVKQSEKLIFITEGIFDCLSIECIGYKSMCLNSVNMASRLIDLIKNNIDTCKDTKFVLALDNDDKGEKATNKIMEQLKELGIDSYKFSFNSKYKDINDYYIADREELEADVYNLFSPPSVYNYMDKFRQNIIKNKNTPKVSTGFEELNKKLNGGLYPGLYTIGAISSLGKTSLTLQIADNIANQGNHVLFFSLEMPVDELISKSVSRKMFVNNAERCKDIGTIQVLNNHVDYCKDEFDKAIEDYTKNISRKLSIIQGNFNMTIDSMVDYVKKFIEGTNIKPVVFIDYLQIIKSDSQFRDKRDCIDDIVVKLKMLSRDFNIPVIVVSSFNRESYSNQVSFNCFKESGGIEYTSDFVLGLQLSVLDEGKKVDENSLNNAKQGNKDGKREVTLVILKNRNGKSNTKQKFDFFAKNNCFAEIEEPPM